MKRSILCLVALSLLAGLQPATAFELSDFVLQKSIDLLEAPPSEDPQDFSGVTMVVDADGRRRIFIVDNKTVSVYEYDLNGKYQRTIRGEGFDDFEGIVYLGNDKFAIVEERRAEISIVTIDATTTSIDKEDAQVIKPRLAADGSSLNPGNTNSGLEGLGYDAKRNVLYVVKEKDSRQLYEVQIDGEPGAATLLGGPTKALKAELDDFAGLHFDNASQDFFVISHESNCVARIGPTGPCRGILKVNGRQVEGVTLSPDGVDLVIVGEARQFVHYRRPQTEQTNQTEPTEPVNQTEPAEPVSQTEPAEQVNQTEPAEPVSQTEPAEPVSQTEPTEQVNQTEPTEQVNQTEPANQTGDATPPSLILWCLVAVVAMFAIATPVCLVLWIRKG